jgi:hypothetical protein
MPELYLGLFGLVDDLIVLVIIFCMVAFALATRLLFYFLNL